MIWVVAIVVAVVLCFMFRNRNTETTIETTTETQAKGYTNRLPEDFHFSSEHIALLDEMQLICYEIARDNRYMKYQRHTFEYRIVFEIDPKSGLASGDFTIQPGGDWENDFSIMMSIEDKRVRDLITRNFDVCSDGHALHYCRKDITGLAQRLALNEAGGTQWSATRMQVGFDSLVKAWSDWAGASPEISCQIVKRKLSDYRDISGKVCLEIIYCYSCSA